jgi:hypothetical protein
MHRKSKPPDYESPLTVTPTVIETSRGLVFLDVTDAGVALAIGIIEDKPGRKGEEESAGLALREGTQALRKVDALRRSGAWIEGPELLLLNVGPIELVVTFRPGDTFAQRVSAFNDNLDSTHVYLQKRSHTSTLRNNVSKQYRPGKFALSTKSPLY